MRACAGSADASARVTTPVPAAVSSTAPRLGFRDPPGEIERIGFEDERDHQALVHFGNRSREYLVGGRHHWTAPSISIDCDANGEICPGTPA